MSDDRPEDVPMELWDSARRMMDAVNLHTIAAIADGRDRPGFVAIRLEDGRSPDNTLYDTRKDAARHQSDPKNFYVKVGKMSMSAREAVVALKFARMALEAGIVFAEEDPQLPQMTEFIPRGNFPRISLKDWVSGSGYGKGF